MSTIFPLLVGSAFIGLIIGFRYRVLIVVLVAPVIAIVSALSLLDWKFWAAVLLTFACLAVNQIAYFVGAWLQSQRERSRQSERGPNILDAVGPALFRLGS